MADRDQLAFEWADQLQAISDGSPDWPRTLETLCRLIPADGVQLTATGAELPTLDVAFGRDRARFNRSWSHRFDTGSVCLSVNRNGPDFVDDGEQAVARCIRQLAASVRRSVLSTGVRRQATELRHAFERLPIGALIVDADLMVRARTRGAERLVTAGDGLSVFSTADGSRVSISDARTDAELRTAVQTMLRIDEPSEQVFTVDRDEGSPCGLWATRLGPKGDHAAFLVVVSDPDAPPPVRADALRQLYGLTPAEARLCAALAAGNTLKAYAESEGVSLETVRSQLKHSMVKTATHKQAQLVRLLITGPAVYAS